MLVYLRDGSAQTIVRASTLKQKMQIKLAVLLSLSILTPGRPVLVLTLYRQAPVKSVGSTEWQIKGVRSVGSTEWQIKGVRSVGSTEWQIKGVRSVGSTERQIKGVRSLRRLTRHRRDDICGATGSGMDKDSTGQRMLEGTGGGLLPAAEGHRLE